MENKRKQTQASMSATAGADSDPFTRRMTLPSMSTTPMASKQTEEVAPLEEQATKPDIGVATKPSGALAAGGWLTILPERPDWSVLPIILTVVACSRLV